VHASAIDSGGHRTQAVYGYVLARQGVPRRVRAVKGASRALGFLLSAGRTVRPASGAGTITLHEVDTAQAKSLIFSRLKIGEPGPEYVHLPVAAWCDDEFAAQLGAERLETRRNKWGVPVKTWIQTRERNEALDTLVYATAALHLIPGLPAGLAQWADQLSGRARTPPAPPTPRGPRREPWLGQRDGWLR
jgi:phage terminase large subunit GpA-like protein